MSLPSLFQNKNSMQIRALPMSLADVRNAALRKKHRADRTIHSPAHSAKCFLQFVHLVEKRLRFLSNHPVINLFIAAIVTNHVHVTTGKNLKEAF